MSNFLTLHTKNIFNSGIIAYVIAPCGKLDLFKYLMTLPDIDVIYQCKKSLELSITCNRLNIVKYIIETPGISIDGKFCTTIDTAIGNGNLDMIKILVSLPEIRDYVIKNRNNLIREFDKYINDEVKIYLETIGT
jgi:hypothetical protein